MSSPRPISALSDAPFKFLLVFDDGYDIGNFSRLASLTSTGMTVGEGGTLERGSRPRFVLQREFTSDQQVWRWHEKVVKNGAQARKTGQLLFPTAAGMPGPRFFLDQVWPAKIEVLAPEPPAGAVSHPERLIETVTFICEGMSSSYGADEDIPGSGRPPQPYPGGPIIPPGFGGSGNQVTDEQA